MTVLVPFLRRLLRTVPPFPELITPVVAFPPVFAPYSNSTAPGKAVVGEYAVTTYLSKENPLPFVL